MLDRGAPAAAALPCAVPLPFLVHYLDRQPILPQAAGAEDPPRYQLGSFRALESRHEVAARTQRLRPLLQPCSLLLAHVATPEDQVLYSLALRARAAAERRDRVRDPSLEQEVPQPYLSCARLDEHRALHLSQAIVPAYCLLREEGLVRRFLIPPRPLPAAAPRLFGRCLCPCGYPSALPGAGAALLQP